jgi:hypothetical protein
MSIPAIGLSHTGQTSTLPVELEKDKGVDKLDSKSGADERNDLASDSQRVEGKV